jgi:hypothetical protein
MYEMEKTFLYVFTLGIFLELEGLFGMQKSLHLPIKRGREGTCKQIHNFGTCAAIGRFSVSFGLNAVSKRVKSSC